MERKPIGVIDSGVGGLTLVRELKALCPGEDILYYGDSANCPYGNRTQEEIFGLSLQMLGFMREKGVKAVAIACNTVSALAERLAPEAGVPLFGIVAPAVEHVAQSGIRRVGVFATEFTISTRIYPKLLADANPEIEAFGRSSRYLAAMVDRGESDEAVEREIKTELGALLADAPVDHVILGCTHYPIVLESFRRCFPGVVFIDPAKELAKTIAAALREEGLAHTREKGRLAVYTSGEVSGYQRVIDRLGISGQYTVGVCSLSAD